MEEETTVITPNQHQGTLNLLPYKWKPGESGNPQGRPKGARSKLSEDFLQDWFEDYQEHGKSVIETVRKKHPDKYFEALHKLLPKDIKIEVPQLQKIAHVIVDVTNDKPIELQEVTDTLTPDQPQPIETQPVTDETSVDEDMGGTHEVDGV